MGVCVRACCRFTEYLIIIHANLAKYCLDVSNDLQPSQNSILEYTRGGVTRMYTFFRICNSHFCHATANHGKFGEHFKGLLMAGTCLLQYFIGKACQPDALVAVLSDRNYHKWLHYVLFCLPIKTGRFSTPDTYAECQKYFTLMEQALATPHFDMPEGVESKEFCGGFILVRKAVPGDAKPGKPGPLYVVELLHCMGVNGEPSKVCTVGVEGWVSWGGGWAHRWTSEGHACTA